MEFCTKNLDSTGTCYSLLFDASTQHFEMKVSTVSPKDTAACLDAACMKNLSTFQTRVWLEYPVIAKTVDSSRELHTEDSNGAHYAAAKKKCSDIWITTSFQTQCLIDAGFLPSVPTLSSNAGAFSMTLLIGLVLGVAMIVFFFSRYIKLPFGVKNPFLKKYIGEEVDRLQHEKEGYAKFDEQHKLAEARADFEAFKKSAS